jgi:NAD(P)-dependent dehydrogenase (short-subunit alcohol dehydrogenase family)
VSIDLTWGLAGKVALVTGAAGDIGRATVELLVAHGALCVAEDIKPSIAELAVAGKVVTLQGDCSEEPVARRAVELAKEHFGTLDILVNNAGRHLAKSILDTTADEWDNVLKTNVRGAFLHSREALRLMAERGSGVIVNVASISSVIGIADQCAYAASKGAVAQLTKALAIEFGGRGIRVNAVAPGAVVTGILDGIVPNGRELLASFGGKHALGRSGQPEEIAAVIAFLASPRSSFVTGALLMADGGFTAM